MPEAALAANRVRKSKGVGRRDPTRCGNRAEPVCQCGSHGQVRLRAGDTRHHMEELLRESSASRARRATSIETSAVQVSKVMQFDLPELSILFMLV